MKEYTGQGVCGGVCVGEAFVFRAQTYEIEEEDRAVDPKESWQAFCARGMLRGRSWSSFTGRAR